MERQMKEQYERWLRCADSGLSTELQALAENPEKLEDAFYRDLEFGTGGLRGILGAGTNRMNIHTVGKASQGLADYVVRHFAPEARKIAVSYDSRIQSDEFARTAAGIFAANGISVCIYPQLMPTPCLSFAVRELHCAAGIMITASHNPAEYNGYKVYGPDGCQITTEAAADILMEIQKLDIFADVKQGSFEAGLENGRITYISDEVYTAFVEAVKSQSVLGDAAVDKDVAIVYSPLNGTGLKPVLRTLGESGYTNITVVAEQEQPDGHFPTCPYPNPEITEAMSLGMEYARRNNAELLLATDPDCDRVGVAARDQAGEYVLFTGNEVGLLLMEYICSRLTATHAMPEHPVFVKTIVTSDLAEQIANRYGLQTVNVLTGFKYIGEQIGLLEQQGRAEDYVFGFEESCGYLKGSYVRDKDAVVAAFLICEMFSYYKSQGIGLPEQLQRIYETYGYCLNSLLSYTFTGPTGAEKMRSLMASLRQGVERVGSLSVLHVTDYLEGLNGLPKADVLTLELEGGSTVIIRPSGTEPKMKAYLSVRQASPTEAAAVQAELKTAVDALLGA